MPKSKYTRTQLEAMGRSDVTKIYREVVPYDDRKNEKHTKAEYATKPFMIDAILKR